MAHAFVSTNMGILWQIPTKHGLVMQPEQELVERARNGDEEAVTLLYEAHVDSIFAYIRYRVSSDVLAEDITSEVFLRMVRGLAGYRDQGAPFRAWLFRIAANLITDQYRQHGKNPTVEIPESYESDDTDPFDHLIQEDEHQHLQRAIQTLPPEYQDLLVLRFVEDMPHTEIARVLNKSAMALRAMQYRALKALAEALRGGNRS
jgi:RNA polymerase sigma-70 factor (ECF subfamily)